LSKINEVRWEGTEVKVILLKNLGRFGNEGEVAEVKDGYARNHLIPKGLALLATDQNFKKLQEIKRTKIKLVEKEKQDFLKLKEKVDKISLTIAVEAKEDETLYGAIGEAQILKFLKSESEEVDIDKGKIELEEPIKKLGAYNIKVNLCPDVEAVFRVWIVKK